MLKTAKNNVKTGLKHTLRRHSCL